MHSSFNLCSASAAAERYKSSSKTYLRQNKTINIGIGVRNSEDPAIANT
jgi:hypothetical protein